MSDADPMTPERSALDHMVLDELELLLAWKVLATARLTRRMTWRALADAMGVSVSTARRAFDGADLRMMQRVARALGMVVCVDVVEEEVNDE